jgi:hypothetical protein
MDKFSFSIELEENIFLKVIQQPRWDSWVPHRLDLLDDKWICDRWGVVLTSSHLKRHCHRLCHARGIVHTFYGLWTHLRTVKVDPIAQKIVKFGKGIFDIQVINVSCYTYSRFYVFDTGSRLFKNKTLCVRITWRSLWRGLMAIKMLMTINTVPPHLYYQD